MGLGMGMIIFLIVIGALNLAFGIHNLAQRNPWRAAVNLIPGTLCLVAVLFNTGV